MHLVEPLPWRRDEMVRQVDWLIKDGKDRIEKIREERKY